MSSEERDETTATDTDEVEGHKASVREATDDGDDVEGHKHTVLANDDTEGDDVEGHSAKVR